MTRLRSWIVLPLALSTLAIADSASPLPPQVAPQYRVDVTAIQTDVLILDDKGLPVSGLALDDFEVYEDGVRQRLDSVQMIGSSSDEAAEVTPRRFVFVINRLGARFSSLVRARDALEGFVTAFLTENDEVMVVDIGYSVKVLQQFGASKDATIGAIRNLPLLRVDYHHYPHSGERYVYEALRSLGQELAGLPGRKTIIFLSNELHTRRFLVDINDTVDALNESNSTVYSIDLELAHQRRFFRRHARYAVGGLSPLANETGGRYFYNQTSIEPSVRRIGEENSSYYLLSFTSSNRARDGKYRKLQIEVRRPGLKVVARRGYVAPKADRAGVAGR